MLSRGDHLGGAGRAGRPRRPQRCGQTTITNLVARLYDPSSGTVRLGMDLRDATLASVTGAVGVVTQESHLFHDTIQANLLRGSRGDRGADPCCSRRRRRSAVAAGLPNNLDTVVGDRGYRLSGGEEATTGHCSLAEGAGPFVLDEATAHLDSESELMVQRASTRAGRAAPLLVHRPPPLHRSSGPTRSSSSTAAASSSMAATTNYSRPVAGMPISIAPNSSEADAQSRVSLASLPKYEGEPYSRRRMNSQVNGSKDAMTSLTALACSPSSHVVLFRPHQRLHDASNIIANCHRLASDDPDPWSSSSRPSNSSGPCSAVTAVANTIGSSSNSATWMRDRDPDHSRGPGRRDRVWNLGTRWSGIPSSSSSR